MSEDRKTRVNNVETGMDISVVGYKEVSGPLGGISVEYQIKVDADNKKDEFKSNFQGETSKTDSFTVNKTFKEIEYFHNKIKTKHAENKDIPDLVADNSPLVENKQMRLKAADNFMSFVAKDKVLSSTKLLYSFLDYDPDKRMDENPSFPRVATVPEKLELSKQTAAEMQTTTATIENKANTFVSDDIFLEKDGNDEVDEEEDLFQEFKRQNAAAATFSESSSSLFTDSPVKNKSGKQAGQYAGLDLFGFAREDGMTMRKNLVVEEQLVASDKTKEPQLGELVDTELLTIDDSLSDIWKEMQQSHHSKVKPEVKPKPLLAPKPSLPRKLPQATKSSQDKPVPAPRTKPVSAPRLPEASAAASGNVQKEKDPEAAAAEGDKQKKVLEMSVMTKESNSKDLSAFDILSYIDSEQQAAQNKQTDNLDLFS